MKKKLLALALAIIFVLGTVATGFAGTFTDVVDTDFEDEVNRLVALGVVNGYPDGTYKPAGLVTRAEFAKIVVTATGVGAAAEYAKGATKFTDVAADHWAAGYINVATDLGIIQGYGDGRFGPEDQVTYAQAITMIVRSLGYEPAAAAKGGYPGGYLAVAAENDITDGITVVANVAANRGDIAIMVDNSLEVDMMVQSSYGDKPTWEVKEGETFLKKLGVDEIKGNVKEIARVNDKLKDKEIVVELKEDDKLTGKEKTYEIVSKDNPEALFGLAVKLLVKDKKVVHVEVDTNAKDILIDTVTVTTDGLYLKVKDKEYKWLDDAKEEAEIYVNFKDKSTLPKDEVYYGIVILDGKEIKFANLFDFEDENIGLVTKVAKDEIEYVSAGTDEVLELDEYDDVYVYNKDFTAASLDDIDENSVIYYWDNKDDEVFIVVVNDVVKGEVTRARNGKVTVDGTNYDAGDYAMYSTNEGKDFDVWDDDKVFDLVDEKAVLYLDLNGEIAAIIGETDITSDTLYGIATWLEEGRRPVLTVFTSEGKEVDYYFEKKEDAEKVDTVGPDAVNYRAGEYAVISYELNSDGEIAKGKLEVEDVVKASNQGSLYEKGADKKYIYTGSDSIANRYYINKDTVIMKALDDGDLDPAVIKYEDLVKMKIEAYGNAIIMGAQGKTADFIVFTNDDFEGAKDDFYFGVVTDTAWKVGSNWKAEIDVFGEGKAEYKVDKDDRGDFGKGAIVAFRLDSSEKVKGDYIGAKNNSTQLGKLKLEVGSKEEAETVHGTVYAVDTKENFIKVGSTEYKVLDGAVLYKVKYDGLNNGVRKFALDGTTRLTRIDDDAQIILILDKNKEVKAALVNPEKTNTKKWDAGLFE